jgi:hypothetical protein
MEAAATSTPVSSCAIGEASEMMAMPALTFRKKHRPQGVPLPGLERTPQLVVYARAFAAFAGVGFPTLRLPTLRRVLHNQARADDHDEVDDAQDREGRKESDTRDEAAGDRRRDERARAETGYGEAGYEASLVGEPLDQGGEGHNVTKADAHTGHQPIGQVE